MANLQDYATPLVVISFVIFITTFFGVYFTNTTHLPVNYFSAFFVIFNGYTEYSSNIVQVVLNVISTVLLIVLTAWTIKLLIGERNVINLVFIAMIASQAFLTYTKAYSPKLQGGLSLFIVDCIATVMALFLLRILVSIKHFKTRDKATVLTIPMSYNVFAVVSFFAVMLLSYSTSKIGFAIMILLLAMYSVLGSLITIAHNRQFRNKNYGFCNFITATWFALLIVLFLVALNFFYLPRLVHVYGVLYYIIAVCFILAAYIARRQIAKKLKDWTSYLENSSRRNDFSDKQKDDLCEWIKNLFSCDT